MTKEEFLNRARNIHGYKYQYIDIKNKILLKDNITIKFGDYLYTQNVNKHLSGKCPEKSTPKKTTEQFIKESVEIWQDRFDYSETIYYGSLNPVRLFDKKRGVFIEQNASLHLRGHEPKSMKSEEFINKSKLVSDFLYLYDKCYYKNITSNVVLTCPLHGDFIINPFEHLNYGNSCKNCDGYKANKKIKEFINRHKINYITQHKFTDCRNIFKLPFDFYIPSMRTCIEFHGLQHFQPVDYFGGVESYQKLKINDSIKSNYCEDNYIDLIRIRYDQIDNIPQILWESLKYKIKI